MNDENWLETIRERWAEGDKLGALNVARRYRPHLPEHTVIQRGWAAYRNPDFYREIGHDPDVLLEDAFDTMAGFYDLGVACQT